MKVEEIADAIAKLPPDQLARFRLSKEGYKVKMSINPMQRICCCMVKVED